MGVTRRCTCLCLSKPISISILLGSLLIHAAGAGLDSSKMVQPAAGAPRDDEEGDGTCCGAIVTNAEVVVWSAGVWTVVSWWVPMLSEC